METFLKKFTDLFMQYKGPVSAMSTIFVIFFVALITFILFGNRLYNMVGVYDESGAIITSFIDSTATHSSHVKAKTPRVFEELKLLNKVIVQRKEFYKDVVLVLTKFNFSFTAIRVLSLALVLTILTKIAGNGWSNVDIGYKYVFITAFIISIISFLFISSYRVQENTDMSVEYYVRHDTLQHQILQNVILFSNEIERDSSIITQPRFQKRCDSVVVRLQKEISKATRLKFETDFSTINKLSDPVLTGTK